MRFRLNLKYILVWMPMALTSFLGQAQQWVGMNNPDIGNQVLVTPYNNGLATCGIVEKDKAIQYSIHAFNGLIWQPIKTFSIDSSSRIHAFHFYNGHFYLGGKVNSFNGAEITSDLIRLNLNSNSFEFLSTNDGQNDAIYTLATFEKNLIIGGLFKSLGEGSAAYLTQFDGSTYSPVSSDVDAVPNGLVLHVFPLNDTLFVSGNFSKVQAVNSTGLVKITPNSIEAIPSLSGRNVRKIVAHKGQLFGLAISTSLPREPHLVSISDSVRALPLSQIDIHSLADIASYKNRLLVVGSFTDVMASKNAYMLDFQDGEIVAIEANDNVKSIARLHPIRGALFATGILTGFRTDISQIARYELAGGIITGKAFLDINEDCEKQLLEPHIPNAVIRATPGPYYSRTDSNGFYSFYLPEGQYKVEILPPLVLNSTACPGNSKLLDLKAQSLYRGENFALEFKRKHRDVRVFLTSNSGWKARQGYRQVYRLKLENIGNSDVSSGIVSLQYPKELKDGLLFKVTPNAQNDSMAFWNYEDLKISGNQYWDFSMLIPEDYSKEKIDLKAEVQAVSVEEETADNSSSLTQDIDEGSFLNEKQIFPLPSLEDGIAYVNQDNTNELIYTINFANYTDDTITSVFVVDTLDPNINIARVQEIGGSHPYSTQIINGPVGSDINTIVWSFRNIDLLPNPSQAGDKTGYSGYISFRVELQEDLPLGTQVKNQASLVFDYYHGWQTNAVLAEISDFVHVESTSDFTDNIQVYPNPVKGDLHIQSDEGILEIVLLDATGKQVYNENSNGSKEKTLDVAALANGMYFLVLRTEQGLSQHKLVLSNPGH